MSLSEMIYHYEYQTFLKTICVTANNKSCIKVLVLLQIGVEKLLHGIVPLKLHISIFDISGYRYLQ